MLLGMSSFKVHPDWHLASSTASSVGELLGLGFQHCGRRLIDAASDQQGPDGARNLVGERYRYDLDWPSLKHGSNPERDFQASFSKLDDRGRTNDQERPQLPIPAL